MVSHPESLLIFDTTLRDGEQSPGCSMTRLRSFAWHARLRELGVDVIEAGFPAASRGDWESVNAIAREIHGATICGLARCTRKDIETAAEGSRAAAPTPSPARFPGHQCHPSPVTAGHGGRADRANRG